MRLHLETVFVVCFCLWIPVAQLYGELSPEDQDGSGDDEFSGSGSGDDDIWLIESEVTTQASPNTTKPIWYTDGPVIFPEVSVTLAAEPETSGHITDAPYTTQITETQPSAVLIIKSFGSDDHKDESTTISNVEEPETTVPLAEKLPVVPMHEEEYTTTAYDKETKESFVIDHGEDENAGHVEAGTETTETPDMETTPLPLTTSPNNLADYEASGDAVESITVQVPEDKLIEKNIIPEQHEPKIEEPKVIDNDFEFEENTKQPRSGLDQAGYESDIARGTASDNDSLLERKEVLGGVIAGGIVGLVFAIMLVALMVYRMKKKDEGSYSLDEHKHPNGGYQKPQKQEEFLA